MCEQREQLVEYLYDEASPETRRAVERHLEGCAECRAEIRAFRNVREDLLAWSVPHPPQVWKAFAPATALPWHRQVPAWAMAAAAGLMFIVGSAGGFVAHQVVEGRSTGTMSNGTTAIPVELTQVPTLDSKAILALVRDELATRSRDLTAHAIPVNNRPFELDAKTEERLLGRMTELITISQDRQLSMVGDYLFKVRQEDELRRRDDGRRMGQMAAELEHLRVVVSQLQAKVQ